MIRAFFAGFLLATGLIAVSAQSSMPPAFFMAGQDISAAVDESAGSRPGMQVGRISNTDDYRINMIHRTSSANPISHERGTEIHFITAGSGTLVTGGVIVEDGQGNRTVSGGQAREVKQGDFVLVPDATPHWYSDVEDSVTYLEVRFYPDE